MIALIQPPKESHPAFFPNALNAPTGLFLVIRPKADSATIIPVLIVPYYSVIGGWVIKYLIEYVKGNGTKLAE